MRPVVQAFEKQNKVNNEDNKYSQEFRSQFRGDFDMSRTKTKGYIEKLDFLRFSEVSMVVGVRHYIRGLKLH